MKQKLFIGADPFPPYQYYDTDGVLKGSDYDTVKAAGEKAGFEMDFLVDEWNIVEAKVLSGELDAVFQVQKTPQREERFHFSKLLRNAVTEVITGNPQLTISSYEEIESKNLRLGVLQSYAYGDEVDRLDSRYKHEYPGNESLLEAIQTRQVDLGIFDAGVKQYLMEKLSISGLYTIEPLTFFRPLYIAFNSADVRDAFNQQL